MSVSIVKFKDGAEAATQAVADMNAFVAAVDKGNNDNPDILPIIGAITTFATIAGTAGSIAQTGLDLANLVGGSSGADEPASLEVLVVNNTKYSVAPFDADTKSGEMTDYGDLILPSESTTYLLTRDKAFTDDDFGDGSNILFSLMINDAQVDFAYYRNDDWFFGFKSGDDTNYEFADNWNELAGGQVTTTDSPDNTKFNFYSTGIERNSGKLQLTLYSVDWG